MAPSKNATFSQARAAGLTFGLELEVLADANGEQFDGSSSERKRGELARNLAKLLPKFPIASHCYRHADKNCPVCQNADPRLRFGDLRVFNPANPITAFGGNSDYLYFLVKLEYLDCPWDKNGFPLFQGLEINTPILDVDELEAGLPKTSQVVSALRNMPMKLTATTGCGLHIHVGVKSGLSLKLAKKVITLTMLLELSLLNVLLPPQRIENSYNAPITLNTKFATRDVDENFLRHALTADCPELKRHFPLSTRLSSGHWNDKNPQGWIDTLTLVWQAEDFERLVSGLSKQFSTSAKTSLNICIRNKEQMPDDEFKPKEGDGNPSTVEFRYPQMSFDINFIRNWTEIACKIVEISTYDSATFKKYVEEIIVILNKYGAKKTEASELLLRCLGLKHQIPMWRDQFKRYAKGEAISFLDKDGFVLPEGKK